MSFHRKLLLLFSLTVFFSVAAVTVIVSSVTREAFKHSEDEQTSVLVSQFQREFNRRGDEVVRDVRVISSSDAVAQLGLAINQDAPDYASFLNLAKNTASGPQLDFLEFVDSQGTILSSAQWPAKFGYKETAVARGIPQGAFLRQEDLPDGPALALAAISKAQVGERSIYVIGGRRLDKNFLSWLDLQSGSRALLFENLGGVINAQAFIDPAGRLQHAEFLTPLIEQVKRDGQQSQTVIHWTSNPLDDEAVHAFPLAGQDNQLLGILLAGTPRRPYLELQRHFAWAAILAAVAGILLALLFSRRIAQRVTQPVEELAVAAREVSQGRWDVRVPVNSGDELGQLADAFNRMTTELTAQQTQLIQSERVAAWRELARRLAHELKNPLFPLQLTVENLVRARERNPEQFDEVFHESSSTLLAEIANLKAIVSRFSEFSRMPQPQFQKVDINDVVRNVARLFQAQMQSGESEPIECKLELGELEPMAGDAELLHRALSNLVLNAMDAMPEGGTLTMKTNQSAGVTTVEVSDTGAGLNAEERTHLFTPYYTKKVRGTGLGLAIVQSVVSDHGGKISVQSEPSHGTSFVIELPANIDKLVASSHQTVES